MAAISDYLENAIINFWLRANPGSLTSPATVYAALFTTATTDAGGGTEVTGGSYARQAVSFGAPSNGVSSNTADVRFPAAGTATAAWGTVTNFAIYDALTVGNSLFHGALAVNKTIDNGDVFTFPTGNLTVTLQ
jgi:hypothetical protein